jgi:hypothetical protein
LQRAFSQRQKGDWEKAYIVLSRVTQVFVRAHKLFSMIDREDDFVIASISRFWAAVNHQYERFESTERLFSYLKMCVNSEIVDTFRKKHDPLPPQISDKEFVNCSPEEIMEIIHSEIGDDDRLLFLADLYFRWAMPAREIIETYPEIFPQIKEVYTLTYELRKQLRSNPDLLECLQKN